jgi:hypothetical protein
MNILFPKNGWLVWLLLVAALLVIGLVAGLAGWVSLWESLPYLLGSYIIVRGFYVYWPNEKNAGWHNRTLGLVFLGFGIFGLLSTAAVVIFHIGINDRYTLAADCFGSLLCLSIGMMNIVGAANSVKTAKEKNSPPP